MGYEKYREQVLRAPDRKLGIFPDTAELSPINPYAGEKSVDGKPWPPLDVVRPWDSLSDDEKRLFTRMAEVYAGFLSHADHEIGRLLDFLEESGQLDNTIVVLVSDNGASGEGGPNGSVNENKFFNGIPDKIEDNMKYLDELGSPATYNHYPVGWALGLQHAVQDVEALQLRGWRRATRWSSRGQRASRPRASSDTSSCTPPISSRRCTTCAGVELPEVVKGFEQIPLEGVSFRSTFESDDVPTPKESGFFSMLGSRAVWHKGWKAVSVHADDRRLGPLRR